MAGRLSIALAAVAAVGLPFGAATAQPSEDRIAAAFAAADTNGDGIVDVGEYVAYFTEVFRALDTNGDGRLTPADLADLDAEAFARADRDGDGTVSLGEAIAERMIVFYAADANGDGVLTLNEILAYDPS